MTREKIQSDIDIFKKRKILFFSIKTTMNNDCHWLLCLLEIEKKISKRIAARSKMFVQADYQTTNKRAKTITK